MQSKTILPFLISNFEAFMVRAKLASGLGTKCRIVYYSGFAVHITKFLMNEEYKLFHRRFRCIFIVLQDVALFLQTKKGSVVVLSKTQIVLESCKLSQLDVTLIFKSFSTDPSTSFDHNDLLWLQWPQKTMASEKK